MSKCLNCDNEANKYSGWLGRRVNSIPVLCDRCNEILASDMSKDDATHVMDYISICNGRDIKDGDDFFALAVVSAAINDENGYFIECVEKLKEVLANRQSIDRLRQSCYGMLVDKFKGWENSSYHTDRGLPHGSGKVVEFDRVRYREDYDASMRLVSLVASQKYGERDKLQEIANEFEKMKRKMELKLDKQKKKEKQKEMELAAAIAASSSLA